MRREGAYPITSEAFYRAVVQAVILFGEETCVFSAAMEKRIVGFHTDFLRQVKGKRARRRHNGIWWQEGFEIVLKEVGTQYIWKYINRQKSAVAQWVDLQPIF